MGLIKLIAIIDDMKLQKIAIKWQTNLGFGFRRKDRSHQGCFTQTLFIQSMENKHKKQKKLISLFIKN